MIHIYSILASFFLTLFFIYFLYDFSKRIGLTDKPNIRKFHKGEIPLIGGLAILFGFSIAVLISPRSLTEWKPLFVCVIPLAVIGVMDDHGEISVKKRIFIQILTSLIMIFYGDVKLINFGNILGFAGPLRFSGLETLVTVICVVGVINALNLIDGIDGLCISICLVTLTSLLILVKMKNSSAQISLIIYFIPSLISVLIVNLNILNNHIKKVFLGDAGTTLIGFFLCWYLIKLSSEPISVLRPITAIWLLTIPIIDTLSVMLRRVKNNKSPFSPGRDHIHHLLMGLGLSSFWTLLILVSISIIFSTIGILSEYYNISEYIMFYSMLIIFLAYIKISNKLFKSLDSN